MASNRHSAEQALEALNRAALTIGSRLELDEVLTQIVDAARSLVGARYGALGVPSSDGPMSRFIYSGLSHEQAREIAHEPIGRGLLGAILSNQRPIRVPDIEGDPRAVGFPEGHPSMRSFLGVPVMAGGELLGNLYLTDKEDGSEFTAEDEKLVKMLAAHAAVAVQNARLYEQVERLAVLNERTRIGMDLHDGVIQSIYAVGLTLESTRLVLPDDADEAAQLLQQAVDGLNNAIRDIRNFILDLRPRRFSGNLPTGLNQLVREFQANTMVPVQLSTPDDLQGLPLLAAQAIFLTAQEALANVARHARATTVRVALEHNNGSVRLSIADDGQGFDPADHARRLGHGLANMQARAERLGGSFRLRSAPGAGTSLTVVIPSAK